MADVQSPAELRSLDRPDGRVAYEVSGSGPLVVCVPGMGDLRSSFRFLRPALLAAGYRVAVTDLRGHGDSDTSFTDYGDEATASDIVALVEKLEGPAIIVGNSMGAGAAVLVASQRPELVSGLVLVGPFVRDPATGAIARMMTRLLMAAPWAAAAWKSYLPKLYAGHKPADFVSYRAAVHAAIRRPGYATAFSLTTRTSHTAAEKALRAVTAPVLVVMGELDPDFSEPATEAGWIAEHTHGEVVMVPDAGHYPQSQQPDLVGAAVRGFADRLRGRG